MSFELFDPDRDVRITAGNLPHWYQPGVTYFVTFRTDDSFPVAVAKEWFVRRDAWLRNHHIDPAAADAWAHVRILNESLQRQYHNLFSAEFMTYLDKGFGDCLLRRPEFAQIVADALRHFDGQRYHLGDFVVMPNHVHLLVCLLGDTELASVCYSWKKFTATGINRIVNRRGRFWQEESFDHLVRTAAQFDYLRRYIAHNPLKAGLGSGEYLYYRRDD